MLFTALKNFLTVWLSEWSIDPRATDPDDFRWRNIYIGVYAGLGGAQGIYRYSFVSNLKKILFELRLESCFRIIRRCDGANNIYDLWYWLSACSS